MGKWPITLYSRQRQSLGQREPNDWSHEEADDPLSDRSPGGVLLGGPSLKCVGVHFSCTAADVTATLAASMTLPADADDNACEVPASLHD